MMGEIMPLIGGIFIRFWDNPKTGLAVLPIPIKVMGSEKRHLFQGKSVFSRLDGSSAAEDGRDTGGISQAARKTSIVCFQI